MQVTATDPDNNTGTAWVDVWVEPNSAPTINDATFSIDENEPNETPVGTVTFNDPDPDDVPSLSITAGNINNVFEIDDNGIVTVNDSTQLNYEAHAQYTLTVQVSDGTETDSATVTVNVNDVNEAPTDDNAFDSTLHDQPLAESVNGHLKSARVHTGVIKKLYLYWAIGLYGTHY